MARYGKDQHGEKTYSRGYRNPAKKELASEVDFQDSWGHNKLPRSQAVAVFYFENHSVLNVRLITGALLSSTGKTTFSPTPFPHAHSSPQPSCRGILRMDEICAYEPDGWRSEERRAGKECRSRWSPYH